MWRPQMTTRRWIEAVGLVTMIAGLLICPRYLRGLAAEHARLDRENRAVSFALTAPHRICVRTEEPTALSEQHARLSRAYEGAAPVPWFLAAMAGATWLSRLAVAGDSPASP
jgi:hypothetical protein